MTHIRAIAGGSVARKIVLVVRRRRTLLATPRALLLVPRGHRPVHELPAPRTAIVVVVVRGSCLIAVTAPLKASLLVVLVILIIAVIFV